MRGKNSIRQQAVVLLLVVLVLLLAMYYVTTRELSYSRQYFYDEAIQNIVNDKVDLPSYAESERRSLSSQWIQYFPHISELVKIVNDSRPMGPNTTNSKQTVITLPERTQLQAGGKMTFNIIAKDSYGRSKPYGGDFFIVTLRRPEVGNDGVVCEVVDHMTGSYSVTCLLPWAGKAILKAILMHPSESILELARRYSTEEGYGYSMKTKIGKTLGKSEETFCSVAFPNKRTDQLCDFSNHKYQQPFKCLKPPSGKCLQILAQQPQYDPKLQKFFQDTYFKPGVNYYTEIAGSGTVLNIEDEQNTYCYEFSKYDTSVDPMTPNGWFLNGKWVSSKVETIIPHSLERVQKCLANKEMFFMGDSTIRQWYFHFRDTLGLKDNTIPGSVWSQSRDCRAKELNITLHYRAHGPPLFNFGPPSAQPYILDSLDNIAGKNETIFIFITIGYHMEMHNPDVYISRLRAIKESLHSFFERNPSSKVYIKGLHYHRRTFALVCPTPWLSYRYDVILRHEFAAMKGVTFFETWDYTLLIDNAGLHPTPNVIRDQMALLMMYFC